VHAVRLQKARNLTAEIEERSDVQVLPNDVNIKVTPRHQAEGVAANDVHFTVPAENRLKTGSRDAVCLASDFLAVRRHVLRSISSNPPFVAFRLSALRRAATMARMLRDAPQFYARIGGVLYLAHHCCRPLRRSTPRLTSILFPAILVPAFIGELSFAVWLTVKGVNVARWQEKAERSTL
jgi:hypothetical protein